MILEFKLGKRELGEAARKGALEWFRTERGTQILAGIWILIVFASHDWTVTGGGYGTDQAGLAGAVFLVNTALALLVKVMYGLVLIWLALVWLESLGAQGLGQVEQRLYHRVRSADPALRPYDLLVCGQGDPAGAAGTAYLGDLCVGRKHAEGAAADRSQRDFSHQRRTGTVHTLSGRAAPLSRGAGNAPAGRFLFC